MIPVAFGGRWLPVAMPAAAAVSAVHMSATPLLNYPVGNGTTTTMDRSGGVIIIPNTNINLSSTSHQAAPWTIGQNPDMDTATINPSDAEDALNFNRLIANMEHAAVSSNRSLVPGSSFMEPSAGGGLRAENPSWVGNISTGVGPPMIRPIQDANERLLLRTTTAFNQYYDMGNYVDVGAPEPVPRNAMPQYAGNRGTKSNQVYLDHAQQSLSFATGVRDPAGMRIEHGDAG